MPRLLERTTFLARWGLPGHHKGSCLARLMGLEIPPLLPELVRTAGALDTSCLNSKGCQGLPTPVGRWLAGLATIRVLAKFFALPALHSGFTSTAP